MMITELEISAVLEYVKLRNRTKNRILRFEIDEFGYRVFFAEPLSLEELSTPLYEVNCRL